MTSQQNSKTTSNTTTMAKIQKRNYIINSEISKRNIIKGTRRRTTVNYNETLASRNNGAIKKKTTKSYNSLERRQTQLNKYIQALSK
jgi:hypothetical protein